MKRAAVKRYLLSSGRELADIASTVDTQDAERVGRIVNLCHVGLRIGRQIGLAPDDSELMPLVVLQGDLKRLARAVENERLSPSLPSPKDPPMFDAPKKLYYVHQSFENGSPHAGKLIGVLHQAGYTRLHRDDEPAGPASVLTMPNTLAMHEAMEQIVTAGMGQTRFTISRDLKLLRDGEPITGSLTRELPA